MLSTARRWSLYQKGLLISQSSKGAASFATGSAEFGSDAAAAAKDGIDGGQASGRPLPLSVTLYVDHAVRRYLNMPNASRKRRLRLSPRTLCPGSGSGFGSGFDEISALGIGSVRGFIEREHIALRDKPYDLFYQLSSNSACSGGQSNLTPLEPLPLAPLTNKRPKPFGCDSEVREVLRHASDAKVQSQAALQAAAAGGGGGLALQLFVQAAAHRGFPPPTPDDNNNGSNDSYNNNYNHLLGMADPMASSHVTLLSFYRFCQLDSPREVAQAMQRLWAPFCAAGRVYVAEEGINGQMAVPSNVLQQFYLASKKVPLPLPVEGRGGMEGMEGIEGSANAGNGKGKGNGGERESLEGGLFLNCDEEMTREAFESSPAFKSLHIRVKDQVLVDGLEEPLDWRKAGREVSPTEWHRLLSEPTPGPKHIVLDCRNSYESIVGTFQGSIPLNTDTFKDTWAALEEKLHGVDKDAPVLTYCTGGIRCVKVNAYLEQRMGFTNVGRLQGGIVAYAREIVKNSKNGACAAEDKDTDGQKDDLLEQAGSESVVKSKFVGVNYTFDERMGSRVTDDVLSQCQSCGTACDTFSNCHALHCHARLIQCPGCASRYQGCCSMRCLGSLSSSANKSPATTTGSNDTSSSSGNSSGDESGRVDCLDVESALHNYCDDVSDAEPPLLQQLAEETKALYSSRPGAVRMISGQLQGSLLAMLAKLSGAKSALELGTFTGYSAVALAYAMIPPHTQAGKKLLRKSRCGILTCDIDAESTAVAEKYFSLFHLEHGIDTAKGKGDEPYIHFAKSTRAEAAIAQARADDWQFDLAFIDADKREYENYLRNLMGETEGGASRLLSDGALILVDNTLWKGLVLPGADFKDSPERHVRVAAALRDFNIFVKNHPQLSVVLLPVRDGFTIIRYSRNVC